jgi:hypothetical protein
MKKRKRGTVRTGGRLISIKNENGRWDVHKAKTRYGKTIWSLLIEYINGLDPGVQFTRGEVKMKIYSTYSVAKAMVSKIGAEDNYMNHLCKIGILKKVKPGVCEKIQNVPEQLTVTKLVKLASNQNWELWFVKPEDW